jgi:DNA replication and repair protein RecF
MIFCQNAQRTPRDETALSVKSQPANMLAHLTLRRFRNFAACEVPFGPGATLFRGLNGQGKTNLLEAIYYLSSLRSFRQIAAPQLVQSGAGGFDLSAQLAGHATDELRVCYDAAEQKRTLEINGNRVGRSVDFVGRLNCVILHAADLKLARGRNSERLRWLDFSIAQIEPGYLDLLARFQRSLKHRNAALKQRVSRAEMDALSEQFTTASIAVADRRRHHWPELSERLEAAYNALAKSAERLGARHQSHADDGMPARLAGLRAAESDAGTSLCGPHRDVVELTLDSLQVSHAGSEGQARSIALAFKIAQARFIREHLGHPPVLLIDDVWGELDRERRRGLEMLMAESPQTVLTSTDAGAHGMADTVAAAAVWEVKAGRLDRAG